MQGPPLCRSLNYIPANKLLCCMEIQPPRAAAGRKGGGLDKGWGGGATMAEYPASPEVGTFASSDKAEGPLSQLTISLSCEPPSAAGARSRRREDSPTGPDRVPRQQ
jgi:hypothetical protein